MYVYIINAVYITALLYPYCFYIVIHYKSNKYSKTLLLRATVCSIITRENLFLDNI